MSTPQVAREGRHELVSDWEPQWVPRVALRAATEKVDEWPAEYVSEVYSNGVPAGRRCSVRVVFR